MNLSIDDTIIIFFAKTSIIVVIILYIAGFLGDIYTLFTFQESFLKFYSFRRLFFIMFFEAGLRIIVVIFVYTIAFVVYKLRHVQEGMPTIRMLIVSTPIWGTTLILPCLGIVLYWVRSRYRLFYGLAEFLVGFITALNVFLPQKFDYSKIEPLAVLQVLGGLYIMVRGLDNVAQGIKGKPIELAWKKIFGV